jgi:putative exosortase-associated protein (TIGR04073 family)
MTPSTPVARRLACAALAAGLLALPGSAAAQTAARKVGRGLAAMTTGFLEVPGNIVQVNRERGPGWGFTLGFVQGLGMIVVRELVGVYEFVTAPLEVPAGFQPIIQPEFPWSYFDESGPRRRK